jgi:sulfite reductase alpha subunit-like flavoprotein
MSYLPGDHIGIYAANQKELIEPILAKLKDVPSLDQPIRIENLKGEITTLGS